MDLPASKRRRLAVALSRFSHPVSALERVVDLIRAIEPPVLRGRTLVSLVTLFSQLDVRDHDARLEDFITLLGRSPQDQRHAASQVVLEESLAVKFLRSILRVSYRGHGADALINDLTSQQATSRIFSLPFAQILDHFQAFFQDTGMDGWRCAIGPSVTRVYSKPEQPALGVNCYGEIPGEAFSKIRISEFVNDRGEVEWNLGAVSRNLRAGKIPVQARHKYFPNTLYPGLGARFSLLALRYVVKLARILGIRAIDVSPSHYHLVFFNQRLGATFDVSHKHYERDMALLTYVESELDKQGVGLDPRTGARTARYYLERSHHVHGGKIPDPSNPQRPFEWHKPRMILDLSSVVRSSGRWQEDDR